MGSQRSNGFRFTIREMTGSLGDIGTLLPLIVGLIAYNGLDARSALALLGLTYILTGAYYRLPVPVQPLKAAAMIAIATGASLGEIRATAYIMGALLLVLSVSRAAEKLNEVFPRVLIKGLQLSLGVTMVAVGARFILSYPYGLEKAVLAAHAGPRAAETVANGYLPSAAQFLARYCFWSCPRFR